MANSTSGRGASRVTPAPGAMSTSTSTTTPTAMRSTTPSACAIAWDGRGHSRRERDDGRRTTAGQRVWSIEYRIEGDRPSSVVRRPPSLGCEAQGAGHDGGGLVEHEG